MSTRQPLESFKDIVELLKCEEVFRELVPELTNLVKIKLMLPASTCTAERSFSSLRRLKTYLRSGMKQQRPTSVAIMNAHKKKIRKQKENQSLIDRCALLMVSCVELLLEKTLFISTKQ